MSTAFDKQIKQAFAKIEKVTVDASIKSFSQAMPKEAVQLSFDETETSTVSYAFSQGGIISGAFVLTGSATAIDTMASTLQLTFADTFAENMLTNLGGKQ